MRITEQDKRTFKKVVDFMQRMDQNGVYYTILEDLDMEQLVKCHDRCKDDCDKVLQGMEKLYQMIGA